RLVVSVTRFQSCPEVLIPVRKGVRRHRPLGVTVLGYCGTYARPITCTVIGMTPVLRALTVSAMLFIPSAAGAQVSVDVHIGPPPAWRPTHIAPQPGPEFVWVDGYWYPIQNRWHRHPG